MKRYEKKKKLVLTVIETFFSKRRRVIHGVGDDGARSCKENFVLAFVRSFGRVKKKILR